MKDNITITARDRESLQDQLLSDANPKWLFFWGHTPSKDGAISKACFSQWWEGHAFVMAEIAYSTAEHFMMAEKARLFRDETSLAKVLKAGSPALAKKIGRTVAEFTESVWLKARWDIVVQGNFLKFSQHPELKTFLLQTGERILVEASPFDAIWGIGMAATDPDAENPAKWEGLNLLGFALMEVREKLRTEELS